MQYSLESFKDDNVLLSIPIVNACYTLTASEKLFLLIILSKIDQSKSISPDDWFFVETFEFQRRRKITRPAAREELQSVANKLFSREIKVFSKEKEIDKFRWIGAISKFEKGRLGIQWNNLIIPYLCELSYYCTISLLEVGDLKSVYSYRVLEQVSQKRPWTSSGKVTVDVEFFCDLIEASETYREYRYLKSKVLKPAIKELSEKEIVNISLKENKLGRNVQSFDLIFSGFDRGKVKIIQNSKEKAEFFEKKSETFEEISVF